jgi:hypothetical protein
LATIQRFPQPLPQFQSFIEWLTELRKNIYIYSLLMKGTTKDTDEHPDEEVHKTRCEIGRDGTGWDRVGRSGQGWCWGGGERSYSLQACHPSCVQHPTNSLNVIAQRFLWRVQLLTQFLAHLLHREWGWKYGAKDLLFYFGIT